ncbi:hypothetical protein WKK05_12725 [Nostoc sp. UHCC 0302]
MRRVTVYYYDDRWVPIKHCYLEKAILLHYQAKIEGREILLFPENLNPNNFDYPTLSNTYSRVQV